MVTTIRQSHAISIHALRKESDESFNQSPVFADISIHALRKESDLTDCQHCHKPIFQSTLSVRRATEQDRPEVNENDNFNPRSP